MGNLGLKMLRKAKVAREKYEEYEQAFKGMDRYTKNLDYVTNDVARIMIEIINHFHEQDVLHIVIDAMDVIFGGLNSTLNALKKIVVEAKPRAELLVVARFFPVELEALDRRKGGGGGQARVLVYAPSMGEDDQILRNVPQVTTCRPRFCPDEVVVPLHTFCESLTTFDILQPILKSTTSFWLLDYSSMHSSRADCVR